MDSEAVVRTDRARVLWQSAEGEKVPIAKEAQEDLEVAWENLEVARVIYEKHKDQVSGWGPYVSMTGQCECSSDDPHRPRACWLA